MQKEQVPEQYVEEIAALGIGEIDGRVKDLTAKLYGESFTAIPSHDPEELDRRTERGKAFLRSPARRGLHWAAGVAVAIAGIPASSLAGAWVAIHAKQEPFFNLPVGLFDGEVTLEKKVQTMRKNAHGEPKSPYQQASFLAHRRLDQDDHRLLYVPGIRTIRKMEIDELLQAGMVATGKMDLVGVRKLTIPELQGTAMLSILTDEQYRRAGIGPEMKWVYQNYPGIMKLVRPRHGGINVRSTLTNGGADFWQLVHHGVRQWGDILYVLNANLGTDFRMLLAFVRGRAIKAAWQGIQKVARHK